MKHWLLAHLIVRYWSSFRRKVWFGVRVTTLTQGFTLLELLIVLAILALLAGLVAPRIIGYLSSARTDTAKMQLQNIEASLDLYRLDVGRYPESLDALVSRPSGVDKWNGPYLRKESGLVDPWGNKYQFRMPGQHGEYDLFSFGADKAEGGEGENQDVKN